MKRVRLRFARGVEVEFVDRDRAVRQVSGIAERGTRFPLVVYGPEGCGKTALLRQAGAIFEEHGYSVVYVDPLAESVGDALHYTGPLRDIVREVLGLFPEPYSRIVDAAIRIIGEAMRRLRRPRVALLLDDLFQAVGPGVAERYVKALLNLIEYPPGDYESIVVMVSSSEGATRKTIGRHSWASPRLLWNMSKDGFAELYDKVPGPKPGYEEAWRLAGGNPRYLGKLYEANWDPAPVIDEIARTRGLEALAKTLGTRERELLQAMLSDPDTLFERLGEPEAQRLAEKLVELNMIVELWDRNEWLWIDTPPPEKDPGLGIGRHYAWQTPLHREAMRKALGHE